MRNAILDTLFQNSTPAARRRWGSCKKEKAMNENQKPSKPEKCPECGHPEMHEISSERDDRDKRERWAIDCKKCTRRFFWHPENNTWIAEGMFSF